MYRERQLPPGEVQRVLARALDLQRAEGGGRDMSEEELARVAAELGVDEALVRRAMQGDDGAQAKGASNGDKSWFTGTPLVLAYERRVARVLGPDDHERVVDTIRRLAGDAGQVTVIGKRIEWTRALSPRNGRRMAITITTSADGTSIRVEDNLKQTAGGLFGGVLGGVGTNAIVWSIVAPAVFGAPIFLTPLLLALVVVVYGILRAAFGALVRARSKTLAEIADKLALDLDEASANVRVDARPNARVEVPEALGDASEGAAVAARREG